VKPFSDWVMSTDSPSTSKKEKKKVAGGLDDEMIADIIFGMDKAVCCAF
jgi:hypothetical protein